MHRHPGIERCAPLPPHEHHDLFTSAAREADTGPLGGTTFLAMDLLPAEALAIAIVLAYRRLCLRYFEPALGDPACCMVHLVGCLRRLFLASYWCPSPLLPWSPFRRHCSSEYQLSRPRCVALLYCLMLLPRTKGSLFPSLPFRLLLGCNCCP